MVSAKPIAGLVTSASNYFVDVATPAIERAIADPDNPSLALAAFTLLYHTKDWAMDDGSLASEAIYWDECPFAQVVAEIANGGKHATLKDKKYVQTPHVLGFQSCGFGEGGWGVGPFGVSNIQVDGIRLKGDAARWHSLEDVLSEVAAWWKARLTADTPS